MTRKQKFHRIRIGIGRPETRDPQDVADYVLSEFTEEEMEVLETVGFRDYQKALEKLVEQISANEAR